MRLALQESENWISDTSDCISTTHVIENLTPNTEYMCRVFAQNKAGLSDPACLEKPIIAKDPIGNIFRYQILTDRSNHSDFYSQEINLLTLIYIYRFNFEFVVAEIFDLIIRLIFSPCSISYSTSVKTSQTGTRNQGRY